MKVTNKAFLNSPAPYIEKQKVKTKVFIVCPLAEARAIRKCWKKIHFDASSIQYAMNYLPVGGVLNQWISFSIVFIRRAVNIFFAKDKTLEKKKAFFIFHEMSVIIFYEVV